MQYITTSIEEIDEKISERKLIVLSEIGLNLIPTATEFVEYMAQKYGASPSGFWYTLKRLKKEGKVDFTERGEEQRPLALTEMGMHVIRSKPAREQSLAELRRKRHEMFVMSGQDVNSGYR